MQITKHPAYQVFKNMKARCYYSGYPSFDRYGGRGIKVCKQWLDDPISFFLWADASGYDSKLQLDRIDNDGDYSPQNCRFVSAKQNIANKSDRLRVASFTQFILDNPNLSGRYLTKELNLSRRAIYRIRKSL